MFINYVLIVYTYSYIRSYNKAFYHYILQSPVAMYTSYSNTVIQLCNVFLCIDQKQIVFRDINNCLTERTKELRNFSHSRLVYTWIFYLLFIFGLSLVVLHLTASSLFQVVLLVVPWLILGRYVAGSLVALGQLSTQKNVLEDIQYYLVDNNNFL